MDHHNWFVKLLGRIAYWLGWWRGYLGGKYGR